MSIRGAFLSTVRDLFRIPEGERDAGFRPILEHQIRRGMRVTAVLGATGAAFFVVVHLVTGSAPVWIQTDPAALQIALADKTLVVVFCVLLLGASRVRDPWRWGRAVLGAVMVASGLAMALDDLVRGDFSFTVAWLVLVMLVAVGTVPYTPRQALAVSGGMGVVYVGVLSLRPEALPDHLHDHRLAYFLFALAIVVTLSSYLYGARYGQHLAQRQAEELRDRLADRTRELEASLAELATAQDEVARHERLAALGRVTAGVAHEIQNPLNFVTNFAALNEGLVAKVTAGVAGLRGRAAGDALDEALADLARNSASILDHGQQAARIVSRMMEHARVTAGPAVEVDVNRFVADHVGEALALAARRGGTPEVSFDLADGLPHVGLRASEMGAALLNVLDNAFRAAADQTARPPRVTVRTRRAEEGVEVVVVDNGPGLAPEAEHRLFEPFFTTRPAGEGAGLGLSLAYDAVTQGHGGTLALRSSPDGAVCVIGLPTSHG